MTDWDQINDPNPHLIREPGKFQPGILGDLLFILSEANIRLLTMGSNHVRTGISNLDEIKTMARITKEALEMWLELRPCKDFTELLNHLRQPILTKQEQPNAQE